MNPATAAANATSQFANGTRGCSLTKTGFQFYYLPTVYIVVFVTGLLGNGVAMWMFARHMRPWSSISVYMFNLALADLCYVLSLPFLIFYYFNKTDWVFGDATCRLQRFVFHLNLYGSILFLACISVHRYSGVVHPLRSLGRLEKRHAVRTSALVWLVVAAGVSPILYYSRTGLKPGGVTTCYDTTSEDELPGYFVYNMCMTVFGFCVPFTVILVCYGFIVRALVCSGVDGMDMSVPLRKKSARLVVIVLAVFAVSYLPYHVMKNLNLRARLYFQGPDMCAFNDRVYATYQVTRGLASLNSCVDPVLYFLAGDTFRRRLSRATKRSGRRSEVTAPSKSEETALNSLAECVENGSRQMN